MNELGRMTRFVHTFSLQWLQSFGPSTSEMTFSASRFHVSQPSIDLNHDQRAAIPWAPPGTPVAVATGVRLPSASTRKPWTLPVPPVRT